ncbi:predicted protein [Histoplasma capsulatum G186AR]|uniref:Uncharacterized protein n=1 Tax=Ajellomyces capsulatus (strain G186AR / H82 / ATCC MYA-2454 / RMSCC 2432) TaxID=447093 RepID=C0NE22_AJECG|nr:uncharacterized protein HCBG_02115 [Histoplasma capsulatum G186AR]EEH10470.1 predicted protein [Histoplasma capsulatum G186AR]
MATIWMMAALSAEPNAQGFHPHLYKTVPVQYLLVAARMQHHRVFKLRRRMASPYFFLFSAVVDIFGANTAPNKRHKRQIDSLCGSENMRNNIRMLPNVLRRPECPGNEAAYKQPK